MWRPAVDTERLPQPLYCEMGSLNLEFLRSPRDPLVPGFPELGTMLPLLVFNEDAGGLIQALILVGKHLTLDSS